MKLVDFWRTTPTPQAPIPEIASADEAAIENAQSSLEDALQTAKEDLKKYKDSAAKRKKLALILKGITIFGGLVIALIPIPEIRYAGVLVCAAAMLDQLLSNHSQLIAEAKAVGAIERTLRVVEDYHRTHFPRILEIKNQSDHFKRRVVDLSIEVAGIVRGEMNRIHNAVASANLKFLENLNIETSEHTKLPDVPPLTPPPQLPAQPPVTT